MLVTWSMQGTSVIRLAPGNDFRQAQDSGYGHLADASLACQTNALCSDMADKMKST